MKPRYVALAGGALMVLGSLLPWATVTAGLLSRSINGTDGDGVLTLIAGVAVVLAAIVAKETPGKFGSILAGIFSLLGGGIAVNAFINVSRAGGDIGDLSIQSSVGVGLYIVIVGAVIGLVGSFLRNSVAPATQTPPSQ